MNDSLQQQQEKLKLEIINLKIRILHAELDTYDEEDEETEQVALRIEQIHNAIRSEARNILP